MKRLFTQENYHLLFEAGVIIKGLFSVGEIILGVYFYAVGIQAFWAFTLVSHAVVKIWLTWALLKNKLWAYPAAAIIFALFSVYQIYRIFYIPSWYLEVFTLFDIIVIVLILHEYKNKKRSISAPR